MPRGTSCAVTAEALWGCSLLEGPAWQSKHRTTPITSIGIKKQGITTGRLLAGISKAMEGWQDCHLKWKQDKLFCEYPLASAMNFCYYGGHSLNLTVHNNPKQASGPALILPKSSFLGGISSQQMSLMSCSHSHVLSQPLATLGSGTGQGRHPFYIVIGPLGISCLESSEAV